MESGISGIKRGGNFDENLDDPYFQPGAKSMGGDLA